MGLQKVGEDTSDGWLLPLSGAENGFLRLPKFPMKIETYNPATGELLQEYPMHTAEEINTKVERAVAAQLAWRKESVENRCALLRGIAAGVREKKMHLAKLATLEMGKPLTQSIAEVEKCARVLDYYAEEAPKMLLPEMVQTEASKSYISYQPLGVLLAIMPWNYPFWQVFRPLAPSLAGGNTLLLKHASNVTGCALAIEEIVTAAGAPAGLFQTLLMEGAAAGELISHPGIAAVTFTGSTVVGRKIAAAAGGALKKHVLELGGSDPYIILEDADLDLAADVCAKSRLNNSGQSCVCAKRFVVVEAVHDAFVSKLTALMKAVPAGNPMEEVTQLGPLARPDLRETLHKQVTDSVEKGAVLQCGGVIPEGAGSYYPPTVLTGVKPGMPAYEEELFGPVAAVIAAANETEALRIANDTEFGLGGAVFSKDDKRAERLAREELKAGNCFVNALVHSDPKLPFGGIKDSGYGRELSEVGMKEFMNCKTVFVR